ncbi:MAG: stage II sporulation protein M [Steroidobacteraceae bacterium]
MSPLQFEQRYRAEWDELRALLAALQGPRAQRQAAAGAGPRIATLYRRSCEHLALATSRGYPAHIVEPLQQLTAAAHQLIYLERDLRLAGLLGLVRGAIPRAVRAQAACVALAALAFALPALVMGLLVYRHPEFIALMLDPAHTREFEEMYAPTAEHIGRARDAGTDWAAFGFYIRHNIGIAFQCFAGGMFLGAGTLFFLVFNGLSIGAVAGYLSARGYAATFYPFVATHSAFELTAIVLAGAAGLRLGRALVAPGPWTRLQALKLAAGEAIVIVYGVILFLLVAALLEAFWSSSAWVPPALKFTVAAVCWCTVLAYLALQGRDAA